LAAAVAVAVVTSVAQAPPAVATVQSGQQEDARAREEAAAAALEASSAEVQAAGVALARVAAELPRAQRAVSTAHGRLVGARAKTLAARARAMAAQKSVTTAQAEVDAASGQVDQAREAVDLLARRAYQQGRWSGLRAVAEADRPQDALVCAEIVAAGELIGRVGSTDNTTGPHLHFEVREEGDPVDPLNYVDEP
jgi:hypothetical protein